MFEEIQNRIKISSERQSIKMIQVEFSGMKKLLNQKLGTCGLNRLNMTEDRISKVEYTFEEIVQHTALRERRGKMRENGGENKNVQSLCSWNLRMAEWGKQTRGSSQNINVLAFQKLI